MDKWRDDFNIDLLLNGNVNQGTFEDELYAHAIKQIRSQNLNYNWMMLMWMLI